MRKVKWIVFITVPVLLLVSPCVTIAEINQTESLRGIKGFYVEILEFDQWAKKAGLTKQSVKTDTELKLRTAGVRVFSLQEVWEQPGVPCLKVAVSSVTFDKIDAVYACNVEVFVSQYVKLARNLNLGNCYSATWSTSNMLIVERDVFVTGVRQAIKDLVDSFLNNYLSVNPKK